MNIWRKVSKRKHLAWNVSYYLLASVIGAIIQVVMSPFYALKMEHFDYAVIGYFTSFGAILNPMISFGLTQYYARKYFLVSSNQRESLRNSVALISIGIALLMSLIGVSGLYIYMRAADVSFTFIPYALLSVANLFFNSLYALFVVDLKMNRKAKEFLIVHVFRAMLTALFATMLVIVFKLGGFGKMLATMLVAISFFGYSLKFMVTKVEIEWVYLKDILKFCWPLVAAGMFGYLTSGFDRAMLERLQDVTNFGLYSIGLQLMGYTSLISTSLSSTFQPDVYRFIAEKKIGKMLLVSFSIIAVSMIPIGIIIVFAVPIVSLLTFGRFTAAAGFARILVLKDLTTQIYYSLVLMLEGYGYTKTLLVTRIVGSLLMIPVFSVLIKYYGFYGAAWGQVLSFLIMTVVTVIYVALAFPKLIQRKKSAIIGAMKWR